MADILLVIGVILILTRRATPLMKVFALIVGLLLAGAFVALVSAGIARPLWLILSAVLIGYSVGAGRQFKVFQGIKIVHEVTPMRRMALGLAVGLFLGIAGGLAALVITVIAASFTGSIHPDSSGGDGFVYFGNIWIVDYALFVLPVAGLIGLAAGAAGSLLHDRLRASVIGTSLGIITMLALLWITYGSEAMTRDVIVSALATGAGVGFMVSSVTAKRAGSWKAPQEAERDTQASHKINLE